MGTMLWKVTFSGLEWNIETVVSFGALVFGITIPTTAVLVISAEVA